MDMNKEELNESKQERETLKADSKELSDDELSKVAGGVASGSTYKQLTLNWNSHYQKGDNHPIIVTLLNSCSLSSHYCCNCTDCESSGVSLYCMCRSKENDPCNGGVEYDPFTGQIVKQF